MSRVVPVGYVLTDEAFRELVTSDPEWQQLNADWEQATNKAKMKAYKAVWKHQDQICARFFAAVASNELPALALKRTASGEWVENQLPSQYIASANGELALQTGSVERIGLKPADRWIADAPLCFRRVDFDQWQSESGRPSTVSSVEAVKFANTIAKRVEEDGLQMSKADMAKILNHKYSMSDRAFEKVWPRIGPEAWHRPGQGNIKPAKKADPRKYYRALGEKNSGPDTGAPV